MKSRIIKIPPFVKRVTSSATKRMSQGFSIISDGFGFDDVISEENLWSILEIKNMISSYESHPNIIATKLPTPKEFLPFLRGNQRMHLCTIIKIVYKKATGCYDISSKLLKYGAVPLTGAMCQLVNMPLSESIFINALKHGHVAALFKHPDIYFIWTMLLFSYCVAAI